MQSRESIAAEASSPEELEEVLLQQLESLFDRPSFPGVLPEG